MKCPNCGNELSNNALFCDNCGQEVPAQSKNADKIFCGNCGAELENGTEFCGNCGTPVGNLDAGDVNYIFCGNCGAKMPDNVQVCANCGSKLYIENNPDLRKRSGKRYVIIIIVLAVVILALAAAIFGYFFYSNSSDVDRNDENIQITATPTASETPTSSPESTDNPGEDSNTQISTNVGKLETYYVVNCNTNISLRETPSTSAKVIREIPLGSPVSYVEASQNGFAKIIYDGTTGYALQAYLSNNAEDIKKQSIPKSDGNTAIGNPVFETIIASSTLPNDGDNTYKATNISDENVATAWVEGTSTDGAGEWISFSSTTNQKVSKISVLNGYCKSESLYNKNNRVKEIKLEFNDGTSITRTLNDKYNQWSNIILDNYVVCNEIKITILSTYSGSAYNDTCISEIKFE